MTSFSTQTACYRVLYTRKDTMRQPNGLPLAGEALFFFLYAPVGCCGQEVWPVQTDIEFIVGHATCR
jgi:hypothetical protein